MTAHSTVDPPQSQLNTQRQIFGAKALLVKFFSCVFAVSAGLYGGQEGPMIHMGAAMGKILSQGVTSSRLPNFTLFKRFRNMYDRRNFISAGAAAGVAAAFKAPVGGLLFVLEEISSFWTHKLAWQTFFCCGVATFTTQAFNSVYHTGSLGAFSGAVFDVQEAINSQLTMFLPTIGVGVIGGLFAALFTWANLKICKYVLCVSIELPRLFTRRKRRLTSSLPSQSQVAQRQHRPAALGAHRGARGGGLHHHHARRPHPVPLRVHALPLPGGPDAPGLQRPLRQQRRGGGGLGPIHVHGGGDLQPRRHALLHQRGPHHRAAPDAAHPLPVRLRRAGHAPGRLLLPLLLHGGHGPRARHHGPRAPHRRCVLFSVLSRHPLPRSPTSTNTTTAVIGRIAGVGVTDIVGIRNSEAWSWVDPGGFALIGAAAFFGGLTRLTFSLAVVMIEITDETHFLLPIMTAGALLLSFLSIRACSRGPSVWILDLTPLSSPAHPTTVMVGKWTADALIDSLYHNLIELKCFPFLSDHPHTEECLDLHSVEEIMATDVVTIPEIGACVSSGSYGRANRSSIN